MFILCTRINNWSAPCNLFRIYPMPPGILQVRHRRTCREARAPKELSSARLCDPPETHLSAGDCHTLLERICYPPLSALRA